MYVCICVCVFICLYVFSYYNECGIKFALCFVISSTLLPSSSSLLQPRELSDTLDIIFFCNVDKFEVLITIHMRYIIV